MWCNGNIAALGAAAMGSIPIIPKKNKFIILFN